MSTMLPIHPQPLPDEILSSWMTRLALENQFPLHTFYSKLLQFEGEIWNRDTDRFVQPQLLRLLEEHTRQPLRVLRKLSLHYYEGILFEELHEGGVAPWLIPLGVYHRLRKRAGIHYCPLCLAEDDVPYFRRRWRLAFYTVCGTHGCRMESGCSKCGSPVAYHRLGVGKPFEIKRREVSTCWTCGYDFRLTEPCNLYLLDSSIPPTLYDVLNSFDSVGWIPPIPSVHSPLSFFKGLNCLVKLIGRRRIQLKLITAAPDASLLPSRGQHLEFEVSSLERRSKLLITALQLIQDWPERFLELCRTNGITSSRITEHLGNEPFWLANIIGLELSRPNAFIAEEEAESIKRYLQKRGISPSRINVQNLLNCSKRHADRVLRALG